MKVGDTVISAPPVPNTDGQARPRHIKGTVLKLETLGFRPSPDAELQNGEFALVSHDGLTEWFHTKRLAVA